LQRAEDNKLKGGIGQRKHREKKPDTLEAHDAAEAVAQRDPHRVGPHDHEVAPKHPEQREQR